MNAIHERVTAIREALQFVASSDIPAKHKSVLMEAVAQALRKAQDDDRPAPARNEGERWQPHEVQIVTAHLEGKVAANWQHADELVMGLAGQLNRSAADVRQKATELGFGVGVDFRQAKARLLRE